MKEKNGFEGVKPMNKFNNLLILRRGGCENKILSRNNKNIITPFIISLLFVLACGGEDGANGVDGANGTSASVQTSVLPAGDASCANGGVKVEVLIDGAVQADETQYICNGANGIDGETGPQGEQGEQGETGANGADSACAGKSVPELEASIPAAVKYVAGKTYSLTLSANVAGLTYQFVAPGLSIESSGEAETEQDGKYISTWEVTVSSSAPEWPMAVIIATDGCRIALAEVVFEGSMEFIAIPAGSFNSTASNSTVEIEAFALAKTPTTVSQFRECVEAGACAASNYTANTGSGTCNYNRGEGWLNHPMNCVDKTGAEEFCEWIGGRLPTEDEWQYAATHDGTEAPETTYAWGNGAPTHCGHANYYADSMWCDGKTGVSLAAGTSAVGTYSPLGDSPLGLQDMAGNVFEWTSSPYNDTAYVVKGGSWTYDTSSLRVSHRLSVLPSLRGSYNGFRCVR